ncbi:MAG: tetratricopeptide repeat protein [Planctomycetes bacterium]|nr:tetratricopeptide repeat protein [Planctomycetota bacterium]
MPARSPAPPARGRAGAGAAPRVRVNARAVLLAAAIVSLPVLGWLLAGERPAPADRLLARARDARAVQDLPRAVALLRTLLQFHPHDPLAGKAWLLLADSLLAGTGPGAPAAVTPAELAAAARACVEAEASGETPDEVKPLRLLLARALASAGQWAGAHQQLELALAGGVGFSPLLLELARAAALKLPPDPDGALAALDRYDALAGTPDEVLRGLLARGALLVLLGRHAEAGSAYRAVAERFPSTPEAQQARLEAGRAFLAAEQRKAANEELSRARADAGSGGRVASEAEAVCLLARLRREEGDAAGALKLLAEAPRPAPRNVELASEFVAASCHLDLGDRGSALACFDRATVAAPSAPTDLPRAIRDLARLADGLELPEDLRAALVLLRRWAGYVPSTPDRSALLRLVAQAGGRLGEGCAARLTRAPDGDVGAGSPGGPGEGAGEGRTVVPAAGELERMEVEGFEAAAEAHAELERLALPGTSGLEHALAAGRALARAGRPLRALVALRRFERLCLAEDPRQAESLWLEGSCLRSLGRERDAEQAFRRSATCLPQAYPFGYRSRLEAERSLRRLGKPETAAAGLEELLRQGDLTSEDPVWRAALLELGCALLEVARSGDPRRPVPAGPEDGELRLLEALARSPKDAETLFRANAELGLRALDRGDAGSLSAAEGRLATALATGQARGADGNALGETPEGAALVLRARLALADCRSRLGQPGDAAEDYGSLWRDRGDPADPVGVRALVGYLRSLARSGRGTEAAAVAREARLGQAPALTAADGSAMPAPPAPVTAALWVEAAARLHGDAKRDEAEVRGSESESERAGVSPATGPAGRR